MGLQVHGDTIESLITERRGTGKEAKELQAQIDRLRAEKAEREESADTAESLEELDRQIEELTVEKSERSQKLRNICRMARTISAGD